MKISCIELPVEEYTFVRNNGRFTDSAQSAINKFITNRKIRNILIFGAKITGSAVNGIFKDKTIGYIESDTVEKYIDKDVDAIIISTAPIHYHEILSLISSKYCDHDIDIITIFKKTSDIEIGFIFETQPRSGTNYVLNNLLHCLNYGYATTYNESDSLQANLKKTDDGLVFFESDNRKDQYIVKTHFMTPLHYPEYRYKETIFQISYIFDAYYSWGKAIAKQTVNKSYKLTGY